ncbi:unnamed protein product [Rotaria sp. Silwood2]|nr:unnamed protein product [Rotaria sp. Silwood2]CAF2936205.1 unnamed protein product [Rotaria sp. Silwood2]CAF3202064.1 unnamed protein product [Rotaria sp. Silwood2]CAF3323071.1 unnamed protein product [Rotaria sp. Silwood2]CAF3985805.1 unnamed protein product [Rotaria sp. Silwood2]
MSKRHLAVQNKGNEHEQQPQSSTIQTRLSSKRANTNELISIKKPKIEEKHVDKENIPKRETRQSTKAKERELLPLPPSPVPVSPIETIEAKPDKPMNPPDNTDDEIDNDEDEYLTLPIDDNDNGKDHPTNKEYVIYENARPNKQPSIISKTARYWTNKYRKNLRHVNPDAYGMYIHADFSCYGELEVVENCLLDLTKTIFIVQQGILARLNYQRKPADKVNYVLGFRRLETLTLLLEYTDSISGIDDGDRFYAIMRVIGSCYVTILRGLLPDVMFKKIQTVDEILIKKLNKILKQIPNFRQVLEQALIIGHMFLTIADVCSAYTNILQIVYCNWVLIMDKISIDLNEKSNDKLMKALKHASQIDRNNLEYGDKESFDFLKELRSYKVNYGLGGDAHDLSKWSRNERAVYSYRRFNPFDGLFSFL